MGYTIEIGNVVFVPRDSDEWLTHYGHHNFDVERMVLPEAPQHDACSPGANVNWPSYSAVAERARTLGIYDFLLSADGLLEQHPGVFRLRQEHAELLTSKLAELRAQHTGVEARYLRDDEIWLPNADGSPITMFRNGGKRHISQETDKLHGLMVSLAWLEWLEFWARWAVAHCERPGIKNT